ncbi:MAG: TIGR01777 family oxidoreductase [Flavobacteriaceae bacterium]
MKILIAGATGLVGRDLVSLCVEKGLEINFLTTKKEKLGSIANAKGFYWNPAEGEIDVNCLEGVSAVINLAGAPIAKRWTSAHKEEILNSRVQSLSTLYRGLEQMEQGSVTSFVSASATGIYPHSLTTYYNENDRVHADGFAASVVEAWEEEAERINRLVPQLAIIRIGLVLTNQGGVLLKMAKPVDLYAGAAFGSGKQWQSWIHVRDLSRMLLYVCEKNLAGKFNAVAPNPVTQNKLIKELAKVLNRPVFLPNIPSVILRILLGEMSEILTSSQRVSSKKIESYGFDFKYQNICAALDQLYVEIPD